MISPSEYYFKSTCQEPMYIEAYKKLLDLQNAFPNSYTDPNKLEKRFRKVRYYLNNYSVASQNGLLFYRLVEEISTVDLILKDIFTKSIEIYNDDVKRTSYTFCDNELNCDWYEDASKNSQLLLYFDEIKTSDVKDQKRKILIAFLPNLCKLRVIRKIDKFGKISFEERNWEHSKLFKWSSAIEKVITQDHILYINKYFNQGDLSELIYSNNLSLNWNTTYSIAGNLLHQLFELHQQRVTHRDIKVENCLWKIKSNRKVAVTLIDFEFSVKNYKEYPKFCGSYGYFSPELLAQIVYKKVIEYVDRRSDIYSMGIIIALLFKNIIADEIFSHVNDMMILQVEKDFATALRYSNFQIPSYSSLLRKYPKGPTYFILNMLDPQILNRPDINKCVQLFYKHVILFSTFPNIL